MPFAPSHLSLLESIFFLVYRDRRIQELLATRAIITGLALASQHKADPVFDEYEKYAKEMLPFLQEGVDIEREEAKKALEEHVKHPVAIDLKPIYRARVAQMRKNLSKRQLSVPIGHSAAIQLPERKK